MVSYYYIVYAEFYVHKRGAVHVRLFGQFNWIFVCFWAGVELTLPRYQIHM